MAGRSKIAFLLLGIYLGLFCSAANAETKAKIKGDQVIYEKSGKKAILKGNAEVVIEEITISGEEIILDQEKRIVYTDKPFKIISKKDGKDTQIIGKGFDFNIETKRLVVKFSSLETDAQSSGQKVYISGEEITIYNKGERISVVNGDFTTCDYIERMKDPHYSIKAASIDFIPDDRVIAWNTTLYFGGAKSFWYPFWYVPLKGNQNDFNLDIGKNETEGMYINFKNYYNLNDYHDGNIFVRLMEKKWLGLGFEHYWMALPTSVSYLYGYSNPVNSRYFFEPNSDNKKNINMFFEDHDIYLRHEQWLPFLPNAQLNFSTQKKNFYNLNSVLSARDDFNDYRFDFRDKEVFQPTKDLIIEFNPDIKASYNQSRTSNIDSKSRIAPSGSNNVLKFDASSGLKINDLSMNFTGNYSNTIRQNLFSGTLADSGGILNYYKSADDIDFRSNATLNYNIFPNLALSGNVSYTNYDPRSFSQPAAVNLSPVQTSPDDLFKQNVNSNMMLNQNLDWGALSLNIENHNDFVEDQIFPKDSSGNIISDASLTQAQKDARDKAISKRKGGGFINKLPELNLTVNPFFQDILPISLSGSLGRYYEASSFPKTNFLGKNLDIVRSEANININSKSIDLGLGNKIDFGGSGYQQRFYQTQDAQYKLTGQLNYKNDFFPFFIPNLSYTKVITDEQNNSPFSWDRFSKDKQDALRGYLNIGNIPEFTLNINNLGYDFGDPFSKESETLNYYYKGYDRGFLSPVTASIKSEFVAGVRFSATIQSGFRLNSIDLTDVNRVNQNYKDKTTLQSQLTTLTDDQFKQNFMNITKTEATNDIASLSDDQLKGKYGIDNRLYDVNAKKVIDETRLTPNDIGKLEFRGGEIQPVNFSLGISTPWEFDDNSFFGKEGEIPWGIAGILSTNVNLPSELYPQEVNGVKKTLTDYQQYANILNKFENTSFGTLFVIGGNWVSHTRVEIGFTLIPPEFVADGQTAKQTNRPSIPLNTHLSIKKDLHDFILSIDFQNQYVPYNNKSDFMFSLNLEMTAFPFSTKDITSGTSNISNFTNKLDSINR